MDRSRYTELFLAESREHVSRINQALLRLEADGSAAEAVEEVFRSVHTLKGMAAAMGYARSAGLAHALEHVLDQIRGGGLGADAEITDTLFDAVDALERAIAREAGGEATVEAGSLLERLRSFATGGDRAAPADVPAGGEVGEGEAALEGPGRTVRVTLMIRASAALPAVRAVLALRQARELGSVGGVDPSEERLNAGDFQGTVAFLLRTDRDADEIRAALLAAGEVAHVVVEEAAESGGRGTREAGGGAGAAGGAVIRIRQERLDALVDQVGELVVARERLRRLARLREDEELQEVSDGIALLIGGLRDDVMGVRMVPVGDVFERFPRLVRDAARSLGKRVEFTMHGRHVELDRSLLNDLGDLLVHLLRNAVDHGIEAPERRAELGKPEVGRIRLSAWPDRSQIAVSVEDDGRGIDRDRVVATAVRKGLLTESEAAGLSDAEVYAFLTRPGFSTAEQVTSVSGRGVGLDVVVSRSRALGGTLEVQSEAGVGTSFTVRLPLSLAIVRCLQVEIAGDPYLVPLTGIEEVAELPGTSVLGGDRILVRDEELALVRLTGAEAPADGAVQAVVLNAGDRKLALEVDALVGQHETTLKPFDAPAGMLPVFSGAALLADGRPALVLDPPRLAAWAGERRGRETQVPTESLC